MLTPTRMTTGMDPTASTLRCNTISAKYVAKSSTSNRYNRQTPQCDEFEHAVGHVLEYIVGLFRTATSAVRVSAILAIRYRRHARASLPRRKQY